MKQVELPAYIVPIYQFKHKRYKLQTEPSLFLGIFKPLCSNAWHTNFAILL